MKTATIATWVRDALRVVDSRSLDGSSIGGKFSAVLGDLFVNLQLAHDSKHAHGDDVDYSQTERNDRGIKRLRNMRPSTSLGAKEFFLHEQGYKEKDDDEAKCRWKRSERVSGKRGPGRFRNGCRHCTLTAIAAATNQNMKAECAIPVIRL